MAQDLSPGDRVIAYQGCYGAVVEFLSLAIGVTCKLLLSVHEAVVNNDAFMAHEILMSCRKGIYPHLSRTIQIVSSAKRHVQRALATDDCGSRGQAMWMACELVEIARRESAFNSDQGFEDADPTGKPGLVVIQRGGL